MITTKCFMCGVEITATEDDEDPRCELCQAKWMDYSAHASIMDGELDHTIEELTQGEGEPKRD